jgi:HPt (histidine-containing phosphotransfer) domain-containing protein
MNELDYKMALDRLGGDSALLAELAGMFEEEYPRLLEAVRRGLSAGDGQAVNAAAHQLKGLLAQFAADRARDVALLVETAGRAGDLQQAAEAFAELERAMEALRPELKAMISPA